MPANREFSDGAPREAWHTSGELRNYSGVPDQPVPVPDDLGKNLIRGYNASMSYSDAQLGLVLDALEELGLSDNTIVVVWGDHGYSLGEHSLWNKHSTFDVATRSALVISAPGLASGDQAHGLVELVDIYPTVTELAGLQPPVHLQGESLSPFLRDPSVPGKVAVFPRWRNADVIRTDRYSYTEWRDDSGVVVARMLYDHAADPGETQNVVDDPRYAADLKVLAVQLAKQVEAVNQ